jgi:hypothetical protein
VATSDWNQAASSAIMFRLFFISRFLYEFTSLLIGRDFPRTQIGWRWEANFCQGAISPEREEGPLPALRITY